MIYYDFKKGLRFHESRKSVVKAFGDQAPSLRIVNNWFNGFQRERQSFEDEHLLVALVQENTYAMKRLIRESQNITHREIEKVLGIGSAAVNTILHEHRGIRKLDSLWIPHLLTDEQKQ